MLTIGLITVIFDNHPSTSNATAFVRTIPILPETNGRVAEIYIGGVSGPVRQGAPIFRLDNSRQAAAVETARRRIAETDSARVVARADIVGAEGRIIEETSAYQQTVDELETKQEIYRRNPGAVALRDIEKLQVAVQGRQGTIDAATAAKAQAKAEAGLNHIWIRTRPPNPPTTTGICGEACP